MNNQSKATWYGIVILMLLNSGLFAQIGIRLKYDKFNHLAAVGESLREDFGIDKFLANGPEIGVDYWFRLKNHRIEFMPEASVAISHADITSNEIYSADLLRMGFALNTHFYILDFKEDCDCPTFSKQGPGINKGFFFHISPGILYDKLSMETALGTDNKANLLHLKIGGGAGIDFGINDILTISPIYTLNFVSGGDWILDIGGNGPVTSTVKNTSGIYHQMAIRVGIRWDY